MIRANLPLAAPLLGLLLTACQVGTDSAGGIPGDRNSHDGYDGIAAGETLRFLGTEPFWGGEVTGGALRYDTIDDPEGETFSVERFAGRGGLSFSGRFEGQDFMMAVTPGECSDGMSDRTYPFTITLQIGDDIRNGCGWTERQPFSGPENP